MEATCDRLLIISKGRIVAEGPIEELRKRARSESAVHVEVEGDGVRAALEGMRGVESVRREEPVDGRRRYVLSVSGDEDVRPKIFRLAKAQGWVLWEIHEETGRLEDLFHALTMEHDGAEG